MFVQKFLLRVSHIMCLITTACDLMQSDVSFCSCIHVLVHVLCPLSLGPQFFVENLAKFHGPVCKILWLTAAKSSKFRGSPRSSIFK